MSLIPFLLVTVGGAAAALLLRGFERTSAFVGFAVLTAAAVAALAIRPDDVLLIGGSGIATTTYLRIFLVLGSTVGLLLAIVASVGGLRRDTPAVTAAILATSALALALPDPRMAVLAAAVGGAFGALLAIVSARTRVGATVGMRVLRATAVAATMTVAATAWIGRDLSDLAAQPIVFGLAYLAVAIAVAIRSGAIPFHPWTARLADTVPETALPLVTVLGPSTLAVVALAWADASIAPLLIDLGPIQGLVLAIAAASILLAPIAAWIQDDIEHLVGYSIVGDAGVMLLAVAALDPEAWAPARTWILIFIVARSAFAAWAAAVRARHGSGRVDDLRGWVRRSPGLGLAFVLLAAASVGAPGLAAFEARASLIGLAIDGPLATLILVGALAPIAYYARLFLVGLARPASTDEGRPDRPIDRWAWRPPVERLDLTDLRGWLARTWRANRSAPATLGALSLAGLALAVALGTFGGPAAAAGLPPSLDGAIESFSPDGPTGPGDVGSPEDPGPVASPGADAPTGTAPPP